MKIEKLIKGGKNNESLVEKVATAYLSYGLCESERMGEMAREIEFSVKVPILDLQRKVYFASLGKGLNEITGKVSDRELKEFDREVLNGGYK